MTVMITLLRGINVGGNKKITMAALSHLYESLGYPGAQTLLQSGNVVFRTDEADEAQIAHRIEAGIEQTFGFGVRILIRRYDTFSKAMAAHPYREDQLAEPAKILVTFLEMAPTAAALQELGAAHRGPEEWTLQGRELFLYYPDGMGRSRLDNNLIERRLGVTGTGRNWNTVNRLLALAGSLKEGG